MRGPTAPHVFPDGLHACDIVPTARVSAAARAAGLAAQHRFLHG